MYSDPIGKRPCKMVMIMSATQKLPLLALLTILALLIVAGPIAAAGLASQARGGAADVTSVLAEIAVYDYGDSRAPLSRLRELVQASLDSERVRSRIEQALIGFLASDATFAGKQFVCEQLSIIGTAASVPVLTGMLSQEPMADIALFALQRIPDPAVDTALRASLVGADRFSTIAIINALGERRDAGAVEELATLVEDADPQTARSAVVALGKIADHDAVAALQAARAVTTGELRATVLDSYLLCADRLLARGGVTEAAGIYRELYDEEISTPVRAAALRGLVESDPASAVDTILAALKRDSQGVQSVAAGLVRELPETVSLAPISDDLAGFSDETQIQLLSAFAHRQELPAHDAVLVATKHHDEEVRAAALAALAEVGNRSDIDLLVQVAVSSGQPASIREAARASLDRMTVPGVDELLIAAIGDAGAEERAELVRSLGARRSAVALPVLLSSATDPNQAVRVESFKALAIVAGPDHIEDVIELLVGERDNDARDEAERTIVLISQKIPPDSPRAAPVMATLSSVRDVDPRSSLIEVLGRIGDPSALAMLEAELSSETPEYRRAAIGALSVWPDASPSAALLGVAETAESEAERILALRGFIELTRLESERPTGESLDRYQKALTLATELSEKRMVLAGLGELGTVDALRVTMPYLDDPELRAEAEAALLRQIDVIRRADDEGVQRYLNAGLRDDLLRILEVARDDRLRRSTTELLERGQ
jgi:HEAT repeat protein